MTFRFFKAVRRPGDWEANFIGKRLNLKVARSQIALWLNYRPLVDLRFAKES